uniref:Uncharacterized protein n=1 Tax=Lotharella oceanica TaxID=641309 RepID=A0A7S2X742_9EUKA
MGAREKGVGSSPADKPPPESGKPFLKRRKAKAKVSHKLKWDAKPRTVCKLETRYIPSKQKSKGKNKTKVASSSKLDFSKVRSKVDSRWKPDPDEDESDEPKSTTVKRPMSGGVPEEITGDKSSFFISVSDYRKAMDANPYVEPLAVHDGQVAEIDAASEWTHSQDSTERKAMTMAAEHGDMSSVRRGNYENGPVEERNEVQEAENRRLREMNDTLVDIEQTVELLIGGRGNFHLFEPPRQTRIPHVSQPEGLHKALEKEPFRMGLKALSHQAS